MSELSEDEFFERNLEKIREINSWVSDERVVELRHFLLTNPEFLKYSVYMAGSHDLLSFAAMKGKLEVCRTLVDMGINVNGDALQLAASSNHFPIVKFLLEAGALIDGPPGRILTPLMSAVTFGHLEVVRYLLDRGADPDILHSRLGQTALDLSMVWEQEEIEILLRSRNAKSTF